MKAVLVLLSSLVILLALGQASAQDDDYAAYFGEPEEPVDDGPASLAEAKKQGRG